MAPVHEECCLIDFYREAWRWRIEHNRSRRTRLGPSHWTPTRVKIFIHKYLMGAEEIPAGLDGVEAGKALGLALNAVPPPGTSLQRNNSDILKRMSRRDGSESPEIIRRSSSRQLE